MEKYYFLDKDKNQHGPVDISELANHGVTKETLVWKQGMTNWQQAGYIGELSGHIPPAAESGATPPSPPAPKPVESEQVVVPEPIRERIPQKPDDYLIWSILATVLCCIPAGVVAIVYSAKVSERWKNKDYAGAVNAASTAKTWCLISLGIGLVVGVISFFSGLLGFFV